MEEQILKLLTANNYPLGEVDDDIQCAKEITAHVLYFLKWFCHNDIIYYEFDKPTQQIEISINDLKKMSYWEFRKWRKS